MAVSRIAELGVSGNPVAVRVVGVSGVHEETPGRRTSQRSKKWEKRRLYGGGAGGRKVILQTQVPAVLGSLGLDFGFSLFRVSSVIERQRVRGGSGVDD